MRKARLEWSVVDHRPSEENIPAKSIIKVWYNLLAKLLVPLRFPFGLFEGGAEIGWGGHRLPDWSKLD